jgi:vacuolar-type H+-ATPase subunit E/Vma4
VQLQIEVVRVTYRIERRRRDSATMEAFRERARSILDELASEAEGKPELQASLAQARGELDGDEGEPPP